MTVQSGNNVDPPETPVVISVDAMGGDFGPSEVVRGLARAARQHPDIRFILHGDSAILTRLLQKRRVEHVCSVVHAPGIVGMNDKPSEVARRSKDSSMGSALDSLRSGDASAVVSCGNTGALGALSMLRLRRLPGVKRPAIAALWPSMNPQKHNVVLDVGANLKADARDLLQYALMGVSYTRAALDVPRPRVGLLNVGVEPTKGTEDRQEAARLIAECAPQAQFEFVGFIEGNDIASDKVDVVVTDGFTGNIALKTAEGTASLIRLFIKQAFAHSILSRFAALFAITSMHRLRRRIDPRQVNGGVFLGLEGTVIKSHGSADATGVAAAILLAYRLGRSGFSNRLAARVASHDGAGHDAPDCANKNG